MNLNNQKETFEVGDVVKASRADKRDDSKYDDVYYFLVLKRVVDHTIVSHRTYCLNDREEMQFSLEDNNLWLYEKVS